MIVIFDTISGESTEVLFVEGGEVIEQAKTTKTKASSSFFLQSVDALIKKTKQRKEDLSGIYLAEGAASFTTTRVGAVVMNTLGYGLDVPVLGGVHKRSLASKDLVSIEQTLRRRRTYTEGYDPQYHHAPTITKAKK